jgi:hypothetical protein
MARAAASEGRERLRVVPVPANFVLGGLSRLLFVQAWQLDRYRAEERFLPVWTGTWEVQLRILVALRLVAAGAGLVRFFALRPWFVRACAKARPSQARGKSNETSSQRALSSGSRGSLA